MNNSTERTIQSDVAGHKDGYLWELAQKRTGFKWSLMAYIFVNAFLVNTWFFTSGSYNNFWPIWPIMGWGIGLLFQYLHAYHSNNIFSAEHEYEKLKNNNQ